MTQALPPTSAAESTDGFDALLMPLLGSAYTTAVRLTRSASDAEDLVQEAALLAFRGYGSFAQGTNFKAWFFRILTNAFYSRARQQRRRGTSVPLEDTPELYLFGHAASQGVLDQPEDAADLLLSRLEADQAVAALDTLPEEHRTVAILYFVNDLSYTEIAASLAIPVGTVRSRLHRGRRMLQRALWLVAQDRGHASSTSKADA